MKTYDVMVVGAGTAGQTAAYELKAHGLDVALADNSGRPGGVCALAGCQAKKYFYEVTETVARSQHLVGKGIQTPSVGEWASILNQKNAFTANIPDNTVNGLYEAGIDYHEGKVCFSDSNTILVADEPLKFRYVVLATGAKPMIDSDKFIGHLVFKTVARGHFIPRIAENIHGEVLLVGYQLIKLGQLGGYQSQGGTGLGELVCGGG